MDLLPGIFSLTFSADGKCLYAGGSDGAASTIERASGKIIGAFHSKTLVVDNLTPSPDGKRLAGVYSDPDGKRTGLPILILELTTRGVRTVNVQAQMTHEGCVFLPNGQFLVASKAPNQLSVWSAKEAQ